jgi:hypothetical protein
MRRAFYTMAAIYLVLAILSLIDMVLISFGLAPPVTNLYWLRLHLLTIGVLAQAVLATLPYLLADRLRVKPPAVAGQWTVWALLNLGLLLLEIGQVQVVAW